MKSYKGYQIINPEDLVWRPSGLMKIPNADYLERTGSENLGARLWRMRVGGETLTIPRYGGVLIGPDMVRQVFNDTAAEVLWLIVGEPEEIEFLQGSKSSKQDLKLIYPTDPTQLPPELHGVEWPPKS